MSVIGMAVVLTAGRGLIAVAAVYATGTLTTEIARWIAARRVCPSLRVSWTAVRWDRISQLVRFGSKTALDDAAALVLTQTNAVAITVFLGPRALALFARPQAICRHLDTLANKLAFVVAPAASALQGAGRTADLRALFVESTRLAMMFALPLVLFVAIMGDILLRVWMGPRYESGGALLSILALGSVLTMGQRPAIQMLVGMNLHGRVAASSVVAVGVALLFVWYAPVHFNLVGCALVVVTPMLVADGMVVPILACRRLGVPLREYIGRVVMQPLASAAPFIGALAISRWCLMRGQTVAASGAVAAGAIVLVCLDWRVVLSRDQRRWVASRLPTWFPAAHLYESAI
jgi:O-antigen/teichoic acid export membrane protein